MKRMALLRRFNTIRSLYQTFELRESSSFLLRSSRSYITGSSNVPQFYSHGASSCLYKTDTNALPWTCRSAMTLRSTMAAEFLIFLNDKKSVSTQAKAPAQARQMGALKVSMTSPGFVYEPYAPGEPISFWKRYFTRSGWRRTKDDIKSELKSAYAIAKLRRSGYSKNQFYKEAVELFKEINTLMANGDKTTLRKVVTENMFSALKNEIKKRESVWSQVYWEMVEPIVKIRTLRARLIGVDKNDINKAFIQLTLEFLSKQKFEAYDSKGAVVAGDRTKEVLVRDIWVFEKSLFHPGAYWRLCGRIKVLYDFIIECLATYAMRSVTLGQSSHQASAQETPFEVASLQDKVEPDPAHDHKKVAQEIPFEDASLLDKVEPDPAHDHKKVAQEIPFEDANLQDKVEPDPAHDHKMPAQEMGGHASVSSEPSKEKENEEEAATRAQAPKKMVSINDKVEEMAASRKKSRKKKGTEKMGSFDQEIDEPKPLKSILKPGI
ncbi:hypothetical protein QUC31_009551 [Theobroma cacao]